MAKQTQIAFDFDDLPMQPAPEKKTVAQKKIVEVPAVVTLPVAVKQKSTRGRKSVKEMSAGVDLIEVPDDEILFQKMYYPIGQVAAWFKVNPSLIRLWENEFTVLKPKKNGKGDRHFRPEDVKNLKMIHHLLREKKYTIEGAKDYLKSNKKADENFAVIEELKKMKLFLNDLKLSL